MQPFDEICTVSDSSHSKILSPPWLYDREVESKRASDCEACNYALTKQEIWQRKTKNGDWYASTVSSHRDMLTYILYNAAQSKTKSRLSSLKLPDPRGTGSSSSFTSVPDCFRAVSRSPSGLI
jgi:hypothetical protein